MKRLLGLLLVLFALGAMEVVLTGCQEESSGAAEELGIQKGRRPEKKEQRPPPGPGDGGSFEQGEEAGTEPSEPSEPSDP